MGARQSFYLDSLAEASTTSASAQTNATLTFTPDASNDHWLIASGAFTHSSTTDNHVGNVALHHTEGAVDLLYQIGQVKEPSSPQDYVPWFGIAKLTFGASPGAQNIEARYWSEVSGDTTKIKDVRILVIKADPADQYASSDGQVLDRQHHLPSQDDADLHPGQHRRLPGHRRRVGLIRRQRLGKPRAAQLRHRVAHLGR